MAELIADTQAEEKDMRGKKLQQKRIQDSSRHGMGLLWLVRRQRRFRQCLRQAWSAMPGWQQRLNEAFSDLAVTSTAF